MKNNKKAILMTTMLLALILLGIGTIAYFRRTVNGDITGQTGNLVLIVNEANAVDNETFEIILKRSEEENFIMPDDSGVFDLNIDSTGSTTDVAISIAISRINLPENLKFYSDEKHTKEITNYGTVIKKSNDMTKTVPVYWLWDGSISDEDDSEFINQIISANISVTATIAKTFYDTLLAMDSTLDTNVDFSQGASETNGQGLMMVNTTQNDEYPVLYYRGDVATNNVIYAGYCWLTVRTTETGGVKLIYNGEVNEDGSCNNYSGVGGEPASDDYFGAYINRTESVFNLDGGSPVHVGYMYNDINKYTDWSDVSGSNLDILGYITHLADNTIDSETGRHNQNKIDSNAKSVIDDWYEENIGGILSESLLEDTVWCNDRSVISETYSIENSVSNLQFLFGASTRLIEPILNPSLTVEPSLICNREIDKFTVEDINGNGDLIYPIGMLTADEIYFAGNIMDINNIGNVITTYLTVVTSDFWALSPYSFDMRRGSNVSGIVDGISSGFSSEDDHGIRPSISLNNSTYILSGNGSFENPYLVG